MSFLLRANPFINMSVSGTPVNTSDPQASTALLSFAYEDSLLGCAKFAFTITHPHPASYKMLNDELPFQLQYGETDGSQEGSWSAVKNCEIVKMTKQHHRSFTVTTVKGLCAGHSLNREMIFGKLWKNARISDIVTELIEEAKLTPKVAETEGKFTLQSEPQLISHYINKYLSLLAWNSRLGTDWRLWVADGSVAYFMPTPVAYGKYAVNTMFTDHEDILERAKNNVRVIKMLNPRVTVTKERQIIDNSGRSATIVWDLARDRYEVGVGSDRTGGFQYLQSRPTTSNQSTEVIRMNLQRDRQTDVSTRQLADRVAKTSFAKKARSRNILTAEVPMIPDVVRPGETVRVSMVRAAGGGQGVYSEHSGLWVIQSVRNVFSQGAVKGYVTMERRNS